MQKNEENPNFFKRKPQKKTNRPWPTYRDSPDHRSDYKNAGYSGADGTRGNSCTIVNNTNTLCENGSKRRLNLKQSSSVVSSEKSNPFSDSIAHPMPYPGRMLQNYQSQFNKKPQLRKQFHSVILNKNTDFKKFAQHQSTLSDYSNKSTTEPINYQAVDINLLSNDLGAECDYNSLEISGDLNKLQIMTAVDFDRDRYARYGIHETEMKDYVRTVTYKNCIEYCSEKYIKNKVVLVIRSGIGLLPLLCVRDGLAKKVIALEQSACIEYARRIVKDNSYSHMITFIQSSVHDLKVLPHGLQQVDVIVSDFMGECVISQGDQMEQVIEARDRFLKPNGLMIPMCVTLYSQLLEHRRAYKNKRIRKCKSTKYKINKKITYKKKMELFEEEANDTDSSSDSTLCSWWSDVYGFDMRSNLDIKEDYDSESAYFDEVEWSIMDEPLIAFFDPCKVVSTACLMKKFDMYKCTVAEVRLVQCKDLRFKCVTPYSSTNGGDYAHMLELFMVVDFPNGRELCDSKDGEQIGFSTSCYSPYTRYRQTGLLFRDQLLVVQGDEFILNEFHMWRGPQVNNPFENTTTNKSSYYNSPHKENLKIRLRYTFVNKIMKAIDRRCAYTIVKELF